MKDMKRILTYVIAFAICITGCSNSIQKKYVDYKVDNLYAKDDIFEESDEIDVSKKLDETVKDNVSKELDKNTESDVSKKIENNGLKEVKSNEMTDDILSDKYVVEDENNSISIEYPIVTGLNDTERQNKINELIRSEALKVYDYYTDEGRGHLDLEVKFNITLNNEGILSIQYYGLGNIEGAPHPHNIFYTTNIDKLNVTKLRLIDFINIKDEFIYKIINGEFEHLGPVEETDLGYYGTYDVLKEILTNADNMESAFSYFKEDSLGITIPAEHSIGGYAMYEINYNDIKEYITYDSQGWKEFIKRK